MHSAIFFGVLEIRRHFIALSSNLQAYNKPRAGLVYVVDDRAGLSYEVDRAGLVYVIEQGLAMW